MARHVWTGVAALLLGSGTAHAEPASAWLERFDVVAACPDRRVFESAVARRVRTSPEVAFAELRLGVSIERAAPNSRSLSGELDITDSAGRTTTRRLEASSCSQLIEAMSLLAAVAADSAQPLRAAPLSAASTHRAPESGVVSRMTADGAHDRALPSARTPDAVRLGPAFYAVLQDAATPEPELGFGLALAAKWPGSGFWSPWLQLGAYRIQSAALPIGAARIRARFQLATAHAIACPLRLPARAIWSLRPCLELDVGQVGGQGGGSALTRVTDRQALWASSGLSLRGEIEPWESLSLSTSIGAVFPWTRHEFFFAPDMEAFKVPALGFRGTLAGALMF